MIRQWELGYLAHTAAINLRMSAMRFGCATASDPAACGLPFLPPVSPSLFSFGSCARVLVLGQVKFLLSTQIQNSPPLVPGAGSLRRRQNLNHPGAR